jgi:dipeptidyl aminopeptidase/acylaminoacyl peptidase
MMETLGCRNMRRPCSVIRRKTVQCTRRVSPLRYIRNEKAPLLVLQGERDIRVPEEEAEQVVAILKAEGRTVDAVYYAEEGHGFIKREHQTDELTRSAAWLEHYLQGKTAAAEDGGE